MDSSGSNDIIGGVNARFNFAILVLMIYGAGASGLNAQVSPGSLRGVVTDPSASLIPNAMIAVTGPDAFNRTARSDAQGRTPMMIQTAIGFERQLPKHLTIATNYIHTSGVHALRSRNINAPLPLSGVLPFGGINAIYLYETSGIYRQNQLMTNVNARISARLSLSGYYVYGTANSNTTERETSPRISTTSQQNTAARVSM